MRYAATNDKWVTGTARRTLQWVLLLCRRRHPTMHAALPYAKNHTAATICFALKFDLSDFDPHARGSKLNIESRVLTAENIPVRS